MSGPLTMELPTSTQNEQSPKRRTRFLERLNLIRLIFSDRIGEDRTTQQAAALTYNTLFSLLPTIVLGLIVMSMAFSNADVQHAEVSLFARFGLTQIHNRGATGPNSHLLIKTLNHIISKVRVVLQNPGTGAVGFFVLLWAAISLMRVIESTFNHIYRVTTPRPWARRLTLYWCVLTLGPLGLAMSFYFSAKFLLLAGAVSTVQIFLQPLTLLASYVSVWVIILLFYKIIPNTLVTWRAAFWGSLAATLLWELGKWGFGLYVGYVAGYGKWYGNLGLIPLFMFWIYLTWIFLLLGVEVAYIQQHFKILLRRKLNQGGSDTPLIDSHWVLPLAVLLVQQFRKGETVTPDLAAKNLHLSPHIAGEFLTALQHAGLVHALNGEENQYALAKAPENITLRELLGAVAHRCQTLLEASRAAGANHPLLSTPVLQQMHEVQDQWTASRTMADLALPTSAGQAAAPAVRPGS